MVLMYSAPVGLAALGETVSQKSGVINIGLEGMMLTSAFAGFLVSYQSHSPWLGVLAAALIGIAMSLISGWFTVCLSADQVVVGTAMNLFAIGVTGTLYRSQFGQGGQLLSAAKLPQWAGLDPLLVGSLFAVPLTALLLKRTGWGLAARAAGEYPSAAEASGFSVQKLRLQAVAIGGLFAGLAGGYLTLGITGAFAENMTAGRGFVAIAMVTFGRWRPMWVFAASLLVGYLNSLQYTLQANNAKVPFQLFVALPYVVALAVLVLVGKGTVAPQALGIPYRREK